MPGLSLGRRGRTLSFFLAAAIGLALAAAGTAERRPSGAVSLRRDVTSIAARRHRALLDLYAATTRLANARLRLAALQGEASRVRAKRALVDRQARIASHVLSVSQTQLAKQLRALYVRGQPDPLAVVLGATSLEEAALELDAIERTANLSSHIVRQTRSARELLARLQAALAARTARLDALEQAAAASVATLASAREQRATLVVRLEQKERLTRQALARLDAKARAAQAKTQALTVTAESTSAPASDADPADPAPAPSASGSVASAGTLTVTATGYSLGGRTATGLPVGWGVAAVDPSVIPLGTRMTVPGYGDAVAADVGSSVRGAAIDLWFPTLALARAWGRRTVVITLH